MDNLRRSTSGHEARWLGDEGGEVQRDELLSAIDQIYSGPPAARIETALKKVELALEAESDNVLYYDEVEAPLVGKLFLALSAAGLYALTFGGSEAAFLERLEGSGHRIVIRDPGQVRSVAEKIQRYLAGMLSSIDVPVDMSGMTDFQRKVLGAVRRVPRGEFVTYGELAQRIGRPRAARASRRS